jgi:hypothetical protein
MLIILLHEASKLQTEVLLVDDVGWIFRPDGTDEWTGNACSTRALLHRMTLKQGYRVTQVDR